MEGLQEIVAPVIAATGRLLVVDDEVSVRKLLRLVLGRDGHSVTDAASVEEARHRMREERFDAILLDLHLPGALGTTLVHELRASAEYRLLPIIMITGGATRDEKIRALTAGVTDFVAKPIDAEELRARVRALVQMKLFADELEDAERVIIALAKTIDARDPYTRDHSERVSRYAALLGERIGLQGLELNAVRRGGLFHDIGKIAIRDDVLLKPERLDPGERRDIERHPEEGAKLIEHMRTLAYAIPVISHHHERWDGSGYPAGLAGEEIPLVARVTTIADVFDALTTNRPYRAASPYAEALDIMASEARRGFWDPRLLEEFRGVVDGRTSL